MLYELIISMQTYLSLILAYVFSVTIAGAYKAWVAKKAGDYTADYAGFLTLDPLVHVDFVGMIILLFTGFGWGRDVPVNPHYIREPHRTFKMLSVYYAQTLMHILLGVCSILLLAGLSALQMGYLGSSTISTTLVFIFQTAIGINIFLAMLRFIQSSSELLFMHVVERHPEYAMYIQLGSLIVTLTLLLVLGTQLQMFFMRITYVLSMFILNLFA